MSATETLTLRLTPELKSQLSELANETQRSHSFLANEALSRYVSRELAIIHGIQLGVEQRDTGRVSDHDDVMTQAEALLAKSAKRRA